MKKSAGRPISSSVREKKSTKQTVQNINRSIRSDFGGRDPVGVILDRLLSVPGLEGLGHSQAVTLGRAVHELIRNQVEGIRKRTSHDREELLRRYS